MTASTIVSVKRLVPADWNPRILTSERFANLKESIKARPEYVEEREILARLLPNGDGEVYAGNQRLRALCALYEDGWMSPWGAGNVPVKLTDISETEAKARALIDNNEWGQEDEQKTAELLYELGNDGVPLDVLGYDDNALKMLLDSVGALGEGPEDPGAQMDRAEELREQWGTARGQLWTIGKHRLLCGDARSVATVTELVASREVDIILTDPPYSSGGFQEAGRSSGSIGTRQNVKIASDQLSTRGYLSLMGDVLDQVRSDTLYLFTDWRMWSWAYDIAERKNYPVRNMLVWDKGAMGMGFPWRSTHELILFAKRTPSEMMDGKHGNVLHFERTGNVNHPTEKPVELLATILGNSTGETVYDPFLGSGTTMVAAEQLGRVCYGMEIEPKYVAVALQRMADIGLTPELSE